MMIYILSIFLGFLEIPLEKSLHEIKEEFPTALLLIEENNEKAMLIEAGRPHGQYLGYPRDYFSPWSPQMEEDSHYILMYLANHSLISIAAHKDELEMRGDRIDDRHPLAILKFWHCDEGRKVAFRNLRSKGWVWSHFIGGVKDSLSTEAFIGNIKDEHIQDFARSLELDAALIYPSIQKKDWDEFIDVLITKIPRKGDYDRYDN